MVNLLEYNSGNQKGLWAEEWLKSLAKDDSANSNITGDILTAFKDVRKEKQIRHYIFSICSQKKDDELIAFCEHLLETYLMFYIFSAIDNKIEPIINKLTTKLYNELVNRLEQSA